MAINQQFTDLMADEWSELLQAGCRGCHSNMSMFVQLQRAVAVKRAIQDVLDRCPRLQALTPPKTREVVQWCRQRGYTPPDLEPQRRNDDESIEDILTQIDSEPGKLAL